MDQDVPTCQRWLKGSEKSHRHQLKQSVRMPRLKNNLAGKAIEIQHFMILVLVLIVVLRDNVLMVDLSWMTGFLHRQLDDSGLHNFDRVHDVLNARVRDLLTDLLREPIRQDRRKVHAMTREMLKC